MNKIHQRETFSTQFIGNILKLFTSFRLISSNFLPIENISFLHSFPLRYDMLMRWNCITKQITLLFIWVLLSYFSSRLLRRILLLIENFSIIKICYGDKFSIRKQSFYSYFSNIFSQIFYFLIIVIIACSVVWAKECPG